MSKRPAKALVLPLRLTDDEREFVFETLTKGVHGARVITRARILFKLDKGCSNADIRDALDTTLGTIVKTRKRYLQGGLEYALGELARPGQKPKFDAVQAATIIATACSKAPDGHDHWTLRMLGSRAVELGFVDSCSPETIRQLLKKASSSPGKNKSGASPR
jgi:transposase